MDNIDQQEFRRLIDELNELNRNLRSGSKGQGADADPASAIKQAAKDFDKSSRGIINAIALLSAKIETSGRFRQANIKETQRKERQELDKFTNSVERATNAQLSHIEAVREAEQAADAEAEARRQREAAEREAARRTTLTAKERAQEDKEQRKRAQAAKDADLKQELELGVKNRNLRIQDRTEAKNFGANYWEQMSRGGDATEMFKNKMSDGIAGLVTSLGGGNKALIGVTTSLKGMGAAVEGVTKGIMNYASALYRGERGALASAKAMTEAAKPVLEFVDLLGNIVSFASMFVPGGILVKGAVLLGGQLLKLGAKAGEAAAKLNELQAEQLDKTMKAFREISTVGASTAGGIEDVFQGMQKLGLTTAEIEQYTEVIKQNSTELALMGGGVAEGRKAFENVADQLKQSGLAIELERLGMTTKEQARSTLSYMKIQARLGTLQGKSVEQLAKESAKYAKELDTLARLTGMSREEAEQAREKALADDRFRAAMDQAREEGDKEFLAQLKVAEQIGAMLEKAGMTEEAAGVRALAAARGAVTTEEAGKVYRQGYGEAIETGDLGKALEVLSQRLPEFTKDFRALTTVAPQTDIVAYSKTQDFAALLAKAVQNAGQGKTITDSIKEAQDEQVKNLEQRTKAMIDLERTQKNIAQDLDTAAYRLIDSAKMHEKAAKALEEAGKTLKEWTGTDKTLAPAGRRFSTSTDSGSPSPATGKGAAASDIAVLRAKREQAEATEKQSTEKLQQARRSGAPPEEVRKLRIEELEARRGAERARALEQHQQKLSGQAGVMGTTPAQQGPAAPSAPSKAASSAPVRPPETSPTDTVTDLSKIFTFGNNSGSRENFDKLQQGFKEKLIAAAKDFNTTTGQKIVINSAFRTPEDQQRLWDESVAAGREGRTAQGRPIARPGSGNTHTQGIAVDIQNWKEAESFLNKYGIDNPIRGDDVHFMKFGGIINAKMGGTRALLAEAGMNEAVVPLPDGKNIPVSLNIENLVDKMQLKQVDIVNGVSETIRSAMANITSTVNNQPSGLDTDLLAKEMGRMSDRLEQMLDVLSSSKDIQSNLLSYSMS